MEALQILAARNLGSRPFSFRERTNGLEINENIRQEPLLLSGHRYLFTTGGKRNLRLYELSNELASLFDEYLMYRPDWVLDWESSSRISTSRDEEWQVSLWREIREDLGDKSDFIGPLFIMSQ